MVSISVYQSLSLHTGQIVKRNIDKPPYYRLLPPAEVMTELASEYPFERFEMFFTIVYMLINIHTGQATYCSAGHPPPILQRKNGGIQRLSCGGGLVGLPDTGPFEQGKLILEQGDRLFLFSDGLIDHTDAKGNCFGEDRLIQNLTLNGNSLQQSCQSSIDAMHNFRGKLPAQDDVSLLGIEFTKSTSQIKP
jgi:sigma-B regulation protein RsbU (phosphoserine phosphatase)